MSQKPLTDCRFNKMVGCNSPANCDKCAWSPEVDKARRKKIRAERLKKMITYSYSTKDRKHVVTVDDHEHRFESVDDAIRFLKERKEKKDERI